MLVRLPVELVDTIADETIRQILDNIPALYQPCKRFSQQAHNKKEKAIDYLAWNQSEDECVFRNGDKRSLWDLRTNTVTPIPVHGLPFHESVPMDHIKKIHGRSGSLLEKDTDRCLQTIKATGLVTYLQTSASGQLAVSSWHLSKILRKDRYSCITLWRNNLESLKNFFENLSASQLELKLLFLILFKYKLANANQRISISDVWSYNPNVSKQEILGIFKNYPPTIQDILIRFIVGTYQPSK